MDFSTINVPERATIHIEHPTRGLLWAKDGTTPCTIEVFGPASDEAVEYRRKAAKRLTERLAKRGTRGIASIPPEEYERMDIEKLVAMTASVSEIEFNGEKMTPSNISSLYSNPSFGWVRDQVSEKIGSWEDFLA